MGDYACNVLEWIQRDDGSWMVAQVLYNPTNPSLPARKIINTFGNYTDREMFALKLRGEVALYEKLIDEWIAAGGAVSR